MGLIRLTMGKASVSAYKTYIDPTLKQLLSDSLNRTPERMRSKLRWKNVQVFTKSKRYADPTTGAMVGYEHSLVTVFLSDRHPPVSPVGIGRGVYGGITKTVYEIGSEGMG